MIDPLASIGDLVDSTPRAELPRKRLLEHLDGDEYVLKIDNSALENFSACDRASFYRLILGRTSAGSSALTYGKAIHAALEVLYRDGFDLSRMLSAGAAVFALDPPGEGEWRTYSTFQQAILGYCSRYGIDEVSGDVFVPLTDTNNRPCVEAKFEDQLGELTLNCEIPFSCEQLVVGSESQAPLYVSKLHIMWTGMIDLLAQQNERLWVVDHKTTSVEGPSYYDSFNMSQQFIGYIRSARKLTGLDVTGALLNVIIGRKPTKTGTNLDFSRRFYEYPEHLIAEWQDDVLSLIEDFVERLKSGYFPKRTLWCTNKFGTCPFMNVCTLPEAHRDMMLHTSAYSTYTWNPLT